MYFSLAEFRADSALEEPEVETPEKSIVGREEEGEVREVPRESSWEMSAAVRPEEWVGEEGELAEGGEDAVGEEGLGGGDIAPEGGEL